MNIEADIAPIYAQLRGRVKKAIEENLAADESIAVRPRLPMQM